MSNELQQYVDICKWPIYNWQQTIGRHIKCFQSFRLRLNLWSTPTCKLEGHWRSRLSWLSSCASRSFVGQGARCFALFCIVDYWLEECAKWIFELRFRFKKPRVRFGFGSVLWRPLIYLTWRAGSVVLLILSLTIVRTGHHSYDGCKHNRLYCRTWWYCSFIIIIMRMIPLLNKHSDIHWEKVVAFYFNFGFHNIGFRFSKKAS